MPDPSDPRHTETVTDTEGKRWGSEAYIRDNKGISPAHVRRLRDAGTFSFVKRHDAEDLFRRFREARGKRAGRPPTFLYDLETVESYTPRPKNQDEDSHESRGRSDYEFNALLRDYKDVCTEKEELRSERNELKAEVRRLKALAERLTREADHRNETLRRFLGP